MTLRPPHRTATRNLAIAAAFLLSVTVLVESSLKTPQFVHEFQKGDVLTIGTIATSPTGDGTYQQWKPKSGKKHYTQVSPGICGAAQFNYATRVGSRDSYTFDLMYVPNNSIITKIGILPCASKHGTNGGPSIMKVFYRFDGANSTDAGNYSLTRGGTPTELSSRTIFSGLSLLKTSNSTLEVGAVYSAGTHGVRLGYLLPFLEFTYPQNYISPPKNLTASRSLNDIILSWIDNSTNEDGFKIERSINLGEFSEIATVSQNTTALTDSAVVETGHFYGYQVRAYNAAGGSSYSFKTYINTGSP